MVGLSLSIKQTDDGELQTKDVSTVPEAVPLWPSVRYISDSGRYWCTVSGLPLFFIFIYIIINIKFYHKIFSQFRTNYSWF